MNIEKWIIPATLVLMLLGVGSCQLRYHACLDEGFSPSFCTALVLR